MADTKISALPSATTPLTGAELVPLVQTGGNVKVSVDNLTAGRSLSVIGMTLTGGTANGVAYLDGSKVLTTGSALTFDGTNFGVGAASPSRFIDFEKNQNSGTVTRIGNTTSGTGAYSALQLSSSAATYLYNFSNGYTTSGKFAAGSTLLDAGGTGGLGINAESVGVILYVASTEQMRLNSSGLEVKQAQLIGYSSYSGLGSYGLAVAGNVGIGTASPAQKLHVASDGYNFRTSNTSNSAGYNIGRNVTDGYLYFYGDQSGANGYVFSGVNGDRAILDSAGELTTTNGKFNLITVGRGAGAVATNTAVGASALAGNTTGNNNVGVGNQALQLNTTGTNNVMVGSVAGYNVSGTLNVGVGYQAVRNASGNHNVGIGGSALVATTSGGFNTAVGSDALLSNTTASSNTAVGYQAAYSNTTGDTISAVGYLALRANTTGRNQAFGAYALYANTTGTHNNAYGDSALYLNTTGNNNTAVGFCALLNNTTASYNTAVGYQAGYSNQTGQYNTTIGTQAGYSNTADSAVTAVGWTALYNNTTGTQNTGVGQQALKANTTGSQNTALGNNAGVANTTGSFNVAVGQSALFSNTTASNNTAVGYQAGYANVTGTNSVFVGTQAGNNSTGSSNVYVGYQITSNSAGASGVNNVGVGTQSFFNLTSGGNNVAVGLNALQANTTASNNTAVGYQALYSNTTASNNTAVGYQAGYNTTTGAANVIMGYLAGHLNTTGAYGTYVGYLAGYNTVGNGGVSLNTFIGYGSGNLITSGTKNSILGAYNGNQGGLDIRTASNYIVLSDGDGNPRGVFDGSGNLYVGATASLTGNAEKLGVTGSQGNGGAGVAYIYNSDATTGDSSSPLNLYKAMTTTSSSARFMQFYAAGTATPMGGIVGNGASNVQFATISDAREKTNIQPMSGSLDKISALKPVAFDWIKSGEHVNSGFIAQDVETVFPEFVVDNMSNEGEEVRKGLTGGMTSGIIPHLVKAIQELKAEFDAYKATHP